MTTEFVLLMFMVIFTIAGVFLNRDTGVAATFRNSGPKLAARVEKHLETGKSFTEASQNAPDPIYWSAPPRAGGQP